MKSNWFPILLAVVIVIVIVAELVVHRSRDNRNAAEQVATAADSAWRAPSLSEDASLTGSKREEVMYGMELIAHTARYFGPNGSVHAITNGMNCENCHLDAGTRPWGSNFGGVAATYPQYRSRSASMQTIAGRVNDCFERSLNGKPIDTSSHEMQAIISYMNWLGKDVPRGKRPAGAGLPRLPFLSRAADSAQGHAVYTNLCQACHGVQGQGLQNGNEYSFPPLWGAHSYNDGAGLYRISSFAGFVKNNMPFNQASHLHPALSDAQAWDVAAYVNSQPRPHMEQGSDWKDISKKPFDFPFGPYADKFSQRQHKYGPFEPIIEADKKLNH